MSAPPSLRPAGWLALVVGWSVLLAAYVAYAATRTPAITLARDATGSVTLTREGWLAASEAEPLDSAPALRLEQAGLSGCRLVLVSPSSHGGEREVATWARRSTCSAAGERVAAAASSLASGAPFRSSIPVTGGQIWWPLPLVTACLFLFERRRRVTPEDLP